MKESEPFASRAGRKLAAALDAFGISPAGMICADFGCNVGGFTDCLLQGGAAKVYAVDTGYGKLAWTLRKDGRVAVMERTNALHAEPPAEKMDLVAIDVAWTPQKLIVPAAKAWLKEDGTIISLLKLHFEREKLTGKKPFRPLTEEETVETLQAVLDQLADLGYPVRVHILSPVVGKGGGREYLLLI